MTTGKFSLQWVNDTASGFTRPMTSVRFNLRDPQGGWGLHGPSAGGLACERLHLDQVHIQFRPTTDIRIDEFRAGDDDKKDWRAETQEVYVRCTPGTRHPLLTRSLRQSISQESVREPNHSLTYSAALQVVPYTGLAEEDVWCRTYRPLRDLPVATDLSDCSELQVDLLWPLLQGHVMETAWWNVPDYRILRVICDFSYT